MEVHEVLAALGIVVGLLGIVLVVTPGLVIELAAVFLWAIIEGTWLAWVVVIAAIVVAVATTVLKYQRPGKRLAASGVPGRYVLLASIVALVGLFVIPVVGAPIAFVLTIYVLTRLRVGRDRAWPSTKAALRAIAHSVGIELAGGFTIALMFFAAALLT